MADAQIPKPGWRTWNNGKSCEHCCDGDRCDDPSHYDRTNKRYGCPHCLNTGFALWTELGRAEASKCGYKLGITAKGEQP